MELKYFIKEAKKRGFTENQIIDELEKKGYSKKEISSAISDDRGLENSIEINPFQKIIYLFSRPVFFFKNLREKSILNSFLLFLIIGVIFTLLSVVLSFLLIAYAFYFPLFGFFTLYLSLLILGIGLAGTFIYSGICHLIVKSMGGQGDYIDSYNAVTYSLIPFSILRLIPFIGLLSFIYSIILMTFGFAEYHKISKGKAVVSVLIPIMLIVILLILLMLYILSRFGVL